MPGKFGFLIAGATLMLADAGPVIAAAPDNAATQQAAERKYVTILKSLHPQTGMVKLQATHVTLDLGKNYYFLNAEDAKRVLTDGWGNPADSVADVLGMVFPIGKTFVDDTWGAVVTYEQTGHVDDEDARTIDYGKLLEDMRAGEEENNKQRQEQGFTTQHLVGWAQAPSYDAKGHTLLWAREIQFAGQSVNSLNYDIRLLGRGGVRQHFHLVARHVSTADSAMTISTRHSTRRRNMA